jgi:hypothetical protein
MTSKSAIKAAISKVIARKEVPRPIQFTRFARPNLGKRLASIFAEAGVDARTLEKAASDEREEFVRLQKKREQYYKKQNAAFERRYETTLKNKKRALEALAGQAIGVETVTVHTASAVATYPRKKMFFESKRLEPWNNYVKFYLHDADDANNLKYAEASIIFVWWNPYDKRLIVRASADVIIKGFCQTIAQQGFISPAYVHMKLNAGMRAYLGGSSGLPAAYGSEYQIIDMSAESYADILGGDGGQTTVDLYEPRNLTLNHLLVNRGQLVVFEVYVSFWYFILSGIADGEFSDENRYVRCPAVVIEYGSEPTVVGPG